MNFVFSDNGWLQCIVCTDCLSTIFCYDLEFLNFYPFHLMIPPLPTMQGTHAQTTCLHPKHCNISQTASTLLHACTHTHTHTQLPHLNESSCIVQTTDHNRVYSSRLHTHSNTINTTQPSQKYKIHIWENQYRLLWPLCTFTHQKLLILFVDCKMLVWLNANARSDKLSWPSLQNYTVSTAACWYSVCSIYQTTIL